MYEWDKATNKRKNDSLYLCVPWNTCDRTEGFPDHDYMPSSGHYQGKNLS